MKTTDTYPPEIIQAFDRLLLSRPTFKREDAQTLWLIYEYLLTQVYRLRQCPGKYKRWCELEKRFIELHGQIREQEEKHKAASTYPMQGPFYWHGMPNKIRRKIFDTVKKSARTFHGEYWYAHENEKV